jgi:predicted methyltransferase MtxX (methanogen marker protein 4)
MASISVLINAQGRTIPVNVNEGQTVGDALTVANIALNNREIRVDGQQVGTDFPLQNSAIILLTDKIKGNLFTRCIAAIKSYLA